MIDCSEQPENTVDPGHRAAAAPADDLAFMVRFEDCTLTESEWTHEAHVRVAWIALTDDFGPAGVDRIRRGIMRFNAEVLGRPGQYHETVTRAFAAIIGSRLSAGETFDEFIERNSDILSPEQPILRRYYSAELLSSTAAREAWVDPDLAPLPIDETMGKAP